MEVLVVAIYGFATRYMEGKRPNDLLLASIAAFVEQVGLPFLICRDFNEPPTKLMSFQYFNHLGAVEAFQWFESKFGSKLPPTCAGSTRNDTVIIHPRLITSIQSMSVLSNHKFDIHTPFMIEFLVDPKNQHTAKWQPPKNWAPFAPSSIIFMNLLIFPTFGVRMALIRMKAFSPLSGFGLNTWGPLWTGHSVFYTKMIR